MAFILPHVLKIFFNNKLRHKPTEQRAKTKQPCLTGAVSLVRSIEKSQVLIHSKVLSCDKIAIKKIP
jgi:hypothetical protein